MPTLAARTTLPPEPRKASGDDGAIGIQEPDVLSDLRTYGVSTLTGIDPSSEKAILGLASLIGRLDLGIDPELTGPPVMDLLYDPKKIPTNGRPAYFTADEFPLHTDLSYVPNPPRFLLMQCVIPAPAGEGLTLLADCSLAFNAVSEDDRRALSEEIFRFRYPSNQPAGERRVFPVHRGRGNVEFWRFRRDIMEIPALAEKAVDEFSISLEMSRVTVSLDRGDLLVIDNYRMAHGRTAFDPSNSTGQIRHLRRVYARTRY